MSRMTASEGVQAFNEAAPPSRIVHYDPEVHHEEMQDMITGLIGAMLKLELESISGPDIGSALPVLVTNITGDVLRIFIDPYVDGYGPEISVKDIPRMKKARQHAELTAHSYSGDRLYLDTLEYKNLNHVRLAAVLQYYDRKFHNMQRDVTDQDPAYLARAASR